MADFVLTANQVGQVITYVAPGYMAQVGYRARYPSSARPPGELLIISVVLSLPLVALASLVIGGPHKPDQLAYVLLLTAGSALVGYGASLLRGERHGKRVLGRLGLRIEPEGSIYALTLKHLSPSAEVQIELKDGRRIEGTPAFGPQNKEDGINELYLTYPTALAADGQRYSVGAGLIVPLAEVSHIVLSEDPTGSSHGLVDEVVGSAPSAS